MYEDAVDLRLQISDIISLNEKGKIRSTSETLRLYIGTIHRLQNVID